MSEFTIFLSILQAHNNAIMESNGAAGLQLKPNLYKLGWQMQINNAMNL